MNEMKKLAIAKAQGKQPKVKTMKSKQPVPMKCKLKEKSRVFEKIVGAGSFDPHKDPCKGKYDFKIGRIHAMTPGKERIFFSGKKKQQDKYELIIEITKRKCANHRKDDEDMADYIHCLIASGNVSKEQAKLEYQNALL